MAFKKLRKYQGEAVEACLSNDVGQLVLPTASGKTIVALETMAKMAREKQRLFAVMVPRILLAKQWISKAYKIIVDKYGLKVNFININSGGVAPSISQEIEKTLFSNGFQVRPIVSTTSTSDVIDGINFFWKDGFSVIMICTYHSYEVLLKAKQPIDFIFYDECQYLVSDGDFHNATNIFAGKKVYATATPKTTDSDSGKGMNNLSVYGPIIYEKKPIEMIKAGAIVGPRIHIIETDYIGGSDYNAIMQMLYDSFLRHRETIKQSSCNSDKIGAKMMVVCDGQKTLTGLLDSKVYRGIRQQNPSLNMFALCTEHGITINDKHIKPPASNSAKEELLKVLYALDNNADAIIFHVDMIGEGLDVPSMTGVFFLRNCGKIRFLQNEGRTARLHPEDAENIENETLKIGDYGNYIKPNCYVLLPYCLDDKDDFLERTIPLVQTLRSDFGFDPSEDVIVDRLHPATVGPVWEEDKQEKEIRSHHFIDLFKDCVHTIETREINDEELLLIMKIKQMSAEEKILMIDNLPSQAVLLSQK